MLKYVSGTDSELLFWIYVAKLFFLLWKHKRIWLSEIHFLNMLNNIYWRLFHFLRRNLFKTMSQPSCPNLSKPAWGVSQIIQQDRLVTGWTLSYEAFWLMDLTRWSAVWHWQKPCLLQGEGEKSLDYIDGRNHIRRNS